MIYVRWISLQSSRHRGHIEVSLYKCTLKSQPLRWWKTNSNEYIAINLLKITMTDYTVPINISK